MPDKPYETIRHELSDGVATITLARPESLNALNATMRGELLRAIKAAGRDDTVRTVVITGEGRAFCSGADLRGGSGERDFRRVLTAEYNPLITAIRELPKPVIAAVNGVAAGAGMSLALACDLVYAADDARLILAFGRIGLVPDSGVTRTLVRALGRHRAAELIFGGEPLSAADAVAAGLVTAACPRVSSARQSAAPCGWPRRRRGRQLAKRAITTPRVRSPSLAMEAALQGLAGRTEDHAEGVAAFGEKREPRFVGR
jgi:2-(1,2-epoxy-1,2-dihydrophenyl)acetyl-CoA isomerase